MSRERQKEPTVVAGAVENLSEIPYHRNVEGIRRILLLGAKLLPSAPIHIAGHLVGKDLKSLEREDWQYTEPHKHEFDEVNIIWSETGELVYRIELDGKVQLVKSPAAILIPAGIVHRAEAISGHGSYFCILLNSSFGRERKTKA